VLFAIVLAAASPLMAQTQDERITQLEHKLDDLLKQAQDIRQQLDQIKGGAQPAQAEDLTKIGVATPPAQPAPPTPSGEQPQTALTDVQALNNQISPAASKVFNPDTSVIGNFVGKAGQPNLIEFGPDDRRRAATFDEAEIAFEAFIDPYAKGKFFFSITPAGIDVEEGFANFVTLPHDLTAKVGKFKAQFGKDNTWHTHVRPWVDQPLVIHNFFGDEGLNDSGVSVSKIFPNSFAYVEGTGEVFSGNVANVFARHSDNDLFYNAHLKLFKDITENSNVEVGTSYARGNTAIIDTRATNQFGGVDVTYRWKPLQQGTYRSFIGRFEGIVNHNDAFARHARGFYASADYQFAQRWFTGVRFDSADRPIGLAAGTEPFRDRGASATLTFWPSEFSQLRGQLRRINYGGARSVTELLLQLQFAIGAHGAHTF
jgi:hypothetical protein